MTCVREAWLVLGTASTPLESEAAGYFCPNLDLGYPELREVVHNRPGYDGADDLTTLFGSRLVSADVTALVGAHSRIDTVPGLFAPYMLPTVRPELHYVLDRPPVVPGPPPVPNRMTADQSSFENTLGTWGGMVNNTALQRSNAHAADGAYSLTTTAQAADQLIAIRSGGNLASSAAIGPGVPVVAMVSVFKDVPNVCRLLLAFYNNAGNIIGGANLVGHDTPVPANAWTQILVQGVTPAGTAGAELYFYVGASSGGAVAAGEPVWIDKAGVFQSATVPPWIIGTSGGPLPRVGERYLRGLRPAAFAWPIVGANQRDVHLQWTTGDPYAYDATQRYVQAPVQPVAPAAFITAGDIVTRPLVRLYGPNTAGGGQFRFVSTSGPPLNFVINLTTGYGGLQAGDVLEIDTVAHTCTKNTVPMQSAVAWNTSTWPAIPPGRNMQFSFATNGGADGRTYADMTWHDGYLT